MLKLLKRPLSCPAACFAMIFTWEFLDSLDLDLRKQSESKSVYVQQMHDIDSETLFLYF
jgi:hypothetical protein